MIYLNVTNSFMTQAHTGIQRVVKKLTGFLLLKSKYKLVLFKDSEMYVLNEFEAQRFFLGDLFDPSDILLLSDMNRGDVFFDIDGSWGDRLCYSNVFRNLKSKGIKIIKMHYDAVPILYPEYCHSNTVYRYIENFTDSINYVDHWICISKTVQNDLRIIYKGLGQVCPPSSVVNLGSDISNAESVDFSSDYTDIMRTKYIISVGTIEPRKNYDKVLDVYDSLIDDKNKDNPSLVLIGKSGWNNENIVKRIKTHPRYNKGLYWFDRASDEQLDFLYKNASVCLCLSHYEGYGLPVVEALARNVKVICSSGGAMEEISLGNENVTPCVLDTAMITGEVSKLLNNHDLTKNEINIYTPFTWKNSADDLDKVLYELENDNFLDFEPEQAVFISIRPNELSRALESIQSNMKFVDRVTILTSDSAYQQVVYATKNILLDLTILRESELGLNSLPEDHQERNLYLRYKLYESNFVDPNFIACDDDFIAIKNVDKSVFYENGRHFAYSFVDVGRSWLGAFPSPTSFDKGIWNTVEYLEKSGLSSALFNSHQPQIINKRLAIETLSRSIEFGGDEWSSYFNIALHLYPKRFEKKNYMTGNWPPNFDSWIPSTVPDEILFLNDPGVGECYLQQANSWKSDLISTYEIVSKRSDIITVRVDRDKACFSHRELRCERGDVICIPILTSETIESLSYSFGRHQSAFHSENEGIPSFIHLPTERCKNSFTLDVSIAVREGMKLVHHSINLHINLF